MSRATQSRAERTFVSRRGSLCVSGTRTRLTGRPHLYQYKSNGIKCGRVDEHGCSVYEAGNINCRVPTPRIRILERMYFVRTQFAVFVVVPGYSSIMFPVNELALCSIRNESMKERSWDSIIRYYCRYSFFFFFFFLL